MWFLDTNALIRWDKSIGNELGNDCKLAIAILSCIEYPLGMKYQNIKIFYPKISSYKKCVDYSLKLRKKGTMIPAIDIVIGTMALERDNILVTDDDHFKVFQAIEPRLKLITFEMFAALITKESDN